MRRSSLITLSLLGVGGSALAASAFTGGNCERGYATLDQCVAAHSMAECSIQTRTGPDGTQSTVAVGPGRSCSAWHSGGTYFMPGYYGGYLFGGGYGGGYWSGRSSSSSPAGTTSGGLSGGSTRGGFGGTGSAFSSGS
jgi:hypothetical protein